MTTFEALKRLESQTRASVFIVGGFVRDYLRKKVNDDVDVVVCGLPFHSIKKFLGKFGSLKEVNLAKTNDKFSVSILLFKAFGDSLEAQITLPRRGKLQIPDSHNTLKQDVKFRDFKINALYLPIGFSSKKDIVDLVGGKTDIANRRITTNGSARERIKESPIRMLRAISLSARTGYTIDQEIIDTIKANAGLIEKCPQEAIRREFNRILMSSKPSKYLRILNNVGLLEIIAPEIQHCVGVKQDKKFHKYDVFTHLIYTCDNCPEDLTLKLAGLLHDIGKPPTKKEVRSRDGVRVTFHKHEMVSIKLAKAFLRRLKYDTDTIKEVLNLVKYHMYHFTRDWTDGAIRKFIKRVPIPPEFLTKENISQFPLFQLRAAERIGNGLKGVAVTDRQKDFEARLIKIYEESNVTDIKDLDIDGNVLIETFKLSPGVQIGNILKFLLENVLEHPELNNRLELLKLATEYLYNNKLT